MTAVRLPRSPMLNGQRIVIEDVRSDLRFAPWREVAIARGFRSVHFTPMLNRLGGPIGVLSAYFPSYPFSLEINLFGRALCRHDHLKLSVTGVASRIDQARRTAENSMDFVGLASLDGHADS